MVKQTDKKSDILNYLIEVYDMQRSELEDKTKEELLNIMKSLKQENIEELIETPLDETKVTSNENTEDKTIPLMTDYDWHDYVMSKFEKDELVDGNPTVDGMRRICELLIGEITDCSSKVLQTPTPENERRATVQVGLCIHIYGNETRTYSGCADVYYGNADGIYGKHPVALAETRAEGRALKRALKLRKVISAEEKIDDNTNIEQDIKSQDPINENQIMFINLCCSKDRANINVEKLVKSIYPKVKHVKEIKYNEAQELAKIIDQYNRKQDSIPEEIKGFDSNWQTNF